VRNPAVGLITYAQLRVVILLFQLYGQSTQGRPKAPSATQHVSQKSSRDKNKEVRGTKFKTVVTRRHILRLKCTKFDFDWGSAPDPAGEFTALPRPPSWI